MPNPISAFPDDNIERVIRFYGGVVRNEINSSLPLVEVLTREIEENNSVSKEAEIFRISLPELDQVRIGSVWKGQNLIEVTKDIYNNFERGKRFNFNFGDSGHEPSSETFDSVFKKNNFWDKTVLKRISTISNKNSNEPSSDPFFTFNKSQLTKLISKDNITVYIPSLEFLTSAVAPEHKQIRRNFILYSLNQIASKYLAHAKINKEKQYFIELKQGKYPSNITLLSYLALNPISRNRLSLIRSSANQSYAENGYAHPIVLPYHPSELILEGDGRWIANNTFLMLRINQFSLPLDHSILLQNFKYETRNPSDPPENDPPRPRLDNPDSEDEEDDDNDDKNDEDIIIEKNPGKMTGTHHMYSQVTITGSNPSIHVKTDKKSVQRNLFKMIEELEEMKHASSGEPTNEQESNDTKQIKQAPLEHEQVMEFKNIEEALLSLPNMQDEKLNVEKVVYINQIGGESNKRLYCKISKKEIRELGGCKGKWFLLNSDIDPLNSKKKPRKFLIFKIYLQDGRSAFLLDIQKSPNKPYSRLIFNTTTRTLTKEIITELLYTIVLHKGSYLRYSEDGTLINIELPVSPAKPHKHFARLDVKKQIVNIIKTALKKELFL